MGEMKDLKIQLDDLIEEACRQPGVKEAMEVYERSDPYRRIVQLSQEYCQAPIITSSSTSGSELQAA